MPQFIKKSVLAAIHSQVSMLQFILKTVNIHHVVSLWVTSCYICQLKTSIRCGIFCPTVQEHIRIPVYLVFLLISNISEHRHYRTCITLKHRAKSFALFREHAWLSFPLVQFGKVGHRLSNQLCTELFYLILAKVIRSSLYFTTFGNDIPA